MAGFGPLIRQAIKQAKPQLKRGAKEALEVPTEAPALKSEVVESVQPTGVIEEAPVPQVVDEKAREALDPLVKESPPAVGTDPKIVADVERRAAQIDVDVEAKRTLSSNLEQFDQNDSWQPNFDTFETGDDVKATIASMADRNKISIDEARRGVVTDEQLKLLSAELNVRGEALTEVMERETGQAVSAEAIIATRQFLNRSGERIVEISKSVVAGTADDKAKLTLRRQLELHQEVTEQFMGARAETGRTLRAFGIKLGDDADQMAQMQSIMETMHGRDLLDVAEGFSKLESMEAINTASNLYTKGKLMGVVEEVFVNSILSGFKTAVVNIGGNILFPMKGMAETAIAARIGKFMPGNDHVLVGEASAEAYGYITAFRDAMRLSAKAFRTGRASDAITRFETNFPRAISSENLKLGGSLMRMADHLNITLPDGVFSFVDKATDITGSAIRIPTERNLTPMDEFFKTLARRGDMARNAYKEAALKGGTQSEMAETIARVMNDPSPAIFKSADDFALYRTFQTPLGKAGQAFQSLISTNAHGWFPGLKLIAPFIRTPTNIFKYSWGDTALALLHKNSRLSQDFAAGGARRDMALAKVSLSSAFIASAVTFTASGSMTGGGPSDHKARKVLFATGWQPYSIMIENPLTGETEYHSYARAEPIAFLLGASADFTEMGMWEDFDDELKTESEHTLEYANALIAGIAENTMSKTFLQGLADFTEMMSDPQRYSKGWFDRLGGAMIPFSSLRRDLTKIQDPYVRSAWEFNDKLKKSSAIPGWSEELPPALSLYGDMRVHPRGDVLGLFSPFPTRKQTTDKVKLEVARVMQESRTVPITFPSKRLGGVKLNVHEYARLVDLSRNVIKVNGKDFEKSLRELIDSDAYADISDEMRSDLIKDVQKGFDAAAKATLLQENNELHEKWVKMKILKAEKKLGKDRVSEIIGGGL